MTISRVNMQHFAGCLLGGAVGDALGWPIEFMSNRQIRETFGSSGIQNYIRADGQLAEITDDTQMTLFTAEGALNALRPAAGSDSSFGATLHESYLRWLHTQGIAVPASAGTNIKDGWLTSIPALHAARAPGITCIKALRSGQMGTIETPINNSKGCGGVMRVAPVGLLGSRLGWDDAAVFRMAAEAAAITHGHPSGYLSAGCLGVIMARIMAGEELLQAVAASIDCLRAWPGHEECLAAIEAAVFLAQTPESRPGPDSVSRLGEGWIAEEALAISIYCALVAGNDFEQGVLLSVNHSGDSDSTGSITGNLLGALLGMEAIPARWLEWLELRTEIHRMASELLMTSVADAA